MKTSFIVMFAAVTAVFSVADAVAQSHMEVQDRFAKRILQ